MQHWKKKKKDFTCFGQSKTQVYQTRSNTPCRTRHTGHVTASAHQIMCERIGFSSRTALPHTVECLRLTVSTKDHTVKVVPHVLPDWFRSIAHQQGVTALCKRRLRSRDGRYQTAGTPCRSKCFADRPPRRELRINRYDFTPFSRAADSQSTSVRACHARVH